MKLGTYQIDFTYENDCYRADMICEATKQQASCESAKISPEYAATVLYDAKYYQKRDFVQAVVRMLTDHAFNKPTTETNT